MDQARSQPLHVFVVVDGLLAKNGSRCRFRQARIQLQSRRAATSGVKNPTNISAFSTSGTTGKNPKGVQRDIDRLCGANVVDGHHFGGKAGGIISSLPRIIGFEGGGRSPYTRLRAPWRELATMFTRITTRPGLLRVVEIVEGWHRLFSSADRRA